MNSSENLPTIFPKGVKASSDYFTGLVWLNVLVPKDETEHYSVADVVFEPGSRTNWHTHPAGQILLVTDGDGYYQERNTPPRKLSKGDVVVIPSHVEHWHGARRDSWFSHLALSNITGKGAVEWLMPVADDDYNRCH